MLIYEHNLKLFNGKVFDELQASESSAYNNDTGK
jgi:hypothetical protein